MTERLCGGCGRFLPTDSPPTRRWCSEECRLWAFRHDTLRPVTRCCKRCSVNISDRRISAQYCSEQCKQRTNHGYVDQAETECPRCGTRFVPNSVRHKYCTTKCSRAVYGQRFRQENPAWFREWRRGPKGAAADQLRRARLAGARTEDFTPHEIYERDKWRCGLCRKRVKKSLRWPDPMSASLDHIIPLACHGEHVRANVHLAHLICNVRKNMRGGGEQLMLFG